MRENYHRLRELSHSAFRVLLVVWLVGMLATAPVLAQTDTATATATPTGETAPCATGPPVPSQENTTDSGGSGGPLEVALVTDTSDSMLENNKLEDAKNASTGFVDRLDSGEEAAAVSYDSGARVDQELTTDHQAVTDAINAYDTTLGSDMTPGIETSQNELLNGTNASADATKAMILLTDGEATNPDQARNAADEAKSKGITIFAIGVGDASNNEDFLNDIASGSDRVYLAPDSSELDSIYQEISGDVEAIGGDLEVETRSLFKPGSTHPYEVTEVTYLSDGTAERTDVTQNATVDTTNTSILSVNDANDTLSAVNDSSTATWVRVDATYNGAEGCTNAIVAEATVENLQLLPNGTWRSNAVLSDSFFQALLVALFVGVAAARFSGAFAGLGAAQLMLTVGWFAGYVPWVYAALGLFLSIFIGLNLAENVDIQVRR